MELADPPNPQSDKKEEKLIEKMARNCVICKRDISRVQFKLIIRKALSRKHNLSLRLFNIQIMNQIINRAHTRVYIAYRERTKYEIADEHLKRYYSSLGKLKQTIAVNTHTQEARPKMYIPNYRLLVNKWVYNKEKLRRKRLQLKSKAKK